MKIFLCAICIVLVANHADAIQGWRGTQCSALAALSPSGVAGMEATFMATILREPSDDTHRLIFADWLEEQGDTRGEIIRLGVELKGELPEDQRTIKQARRNTLIKNWLDQVRQDKGTPNFLEKFLILTAGADPRVAEFAKIEHEGEPTFELQTTHLTRHFLEFLNDEPEGTPELNRNDLNHPISIGPIDAKKLIKNLNQYDKTYKYRLPTTPEWKRATNHPPVNQENFRADRKFGDPGVTADHAWYRDNTKELQPVGTRDPSDGGLFDLYGNTWDLVLLPPRPVSITPWEGRGGSFQSDETDINNSSFHLPPDTFPPSMRGEEEILTSIRLVRELRESDSETPAP